MARIIGRSNVSRYASFRTADTTNAPINIDDDQEVTNDPNSTFYKTDNGTHIVVFIPSPDNDSLGMVVVYGYCSKCGKFSRINPHTKGSCGRSGVLGDKHPITSAKDKYENNIELLIYLNFKCSSNMMLKTCIRIAQDDNPDWTLDNSKLTSYFDMDDVELLLNMYLSNNELDTNTSGGSGITNLQSLSINPLRGEAGVGSSEYIRTPLSTPISTHLQRLQDQQGGTKRGPYSNRSNTPGGSAAGVGRDDKSRRRTDSNPGITDHSDLSSQHAGGIGMYNNIPRFDIPSYTEQDNGNHREQKISKPDTHVTRPLTTGFHMPQISYHNHAMHVNRPRSQSMDSPKVKNAFDHILDEFDELSQRERAGGLANIGGEGMWGSANIGREGVWRAKEGEGQGRVGAGWVGAVGLANIGRGSASRARGSGEQGGVGGFADIGGGSCKGERGG